MAAYTHSVFLIIGALLIIAGESRLAKLLEMFEFVATFKGRGARRRRRRRRQNAILARHKSCRGGEELASKNDSVSVRVILVVCPQLSATRLWVSTASASPGSAWAR